MNALRRSLLALYALLLGAAAGGLIALAWNDSKQLDLNVSTLNVQAFISATDTAKAVFTVIMGAVILVALLSLWVAFAPTAAGRRGKLSLRQSDGGTVEVSTESLESLLKDELEQLPEVRHAEPAVRLHKGAVETDIAASIEPSTSIAHVTSLIGHTVTQTLRDQVGVSDVRRPHVRVRYDEINARPVSVQDREARMGPAYRTRDRELPVASEQHVEEAEWHEPVESRRD